VAALVPAVGNVLALVATLEGKSVSAEDAQSIQKAATEATADLQLIQSLITQYKAAEASAQPGILSQIQAATEATQTTLNELLPALHSEDAATRAKITAVVGIVQAEVNSLVAVMPLMNEEPTSRAKGAREMGHPNAKKGHPGAPLGANEFVGLYNATMTARTGNADVDRATAKLKIHLHGRLERWMTAGWMK
jgi:hypothetical protein